MADPRQQALELSNVGHGDAQQKAVLAHEVVELSDRGQRRQLTHQSFDGSVVVPLEPDERLQPTTDGQGVDDGAVVPQNTGLLQAPNTAGRSGWGQVDPDRQLAVAQPCVGLELAEQRYVCAVEVDRHECEVSECEVARGRDGDRWKGLGPLGRESCAGCCRSAVSARTWA